MTQNNMPSPDEGKPEGAPQVPAAAVPDNGQPDSGTPTPAPTAEDLNAENARLKAELEQKNRDYGASSREAQLLVEQIKQKDAQIESLTKPHDPTEQELRAAYPEWDSMLPSEQRLARENASLKKGLANTQQTTAELAAEIRWGKDLKKLVKQDKYSGLKGREDEFESYVFQSSHKGIPVETLAQSFLFGTIAQAPQAPAQVSAAAAPTGERSSGGPPPGGPKKLTADEARILRQNNYEEYRKQVNAGNIDFDF